MGIDWKDIVRTAAPSLATVLAGGNPLAGMAVKALSDKLLGRPDGTEADIEVAVLGASPADLLKLREAENEFKLGLKEANIDLEKVHADDRDSARDKEIATKDKTPKILAVVFIIGFFGFLYYMVTKGLPETGGTKEVLLILTGVLAGAVTQILNYYFGSSKGSADKTKLLSK